MVLVKDLRVFDDIWAYERRPYWHLIHLCRLGRQLNTVYFDTIYDLQESRRSRLYRKLFLWCHGVQMFNGFDQSREYRMPMFDYWNAHLRSVGIDRCFPPSFDEIDIDITSMYLPKPYVLRRLVRPGDSLALADSILGSFSTALLNKNITPVHWSVPMLIAR